jgi:hypothetical protein
MLLIWSLFSNQIILLHNNEHATGSGSSQSFTSTCFISLSWFLGNPASETWSLVAPRQLAGNESALFTWNIFGKLPIVYIRVASLFALTYSTQQLPQMNGSSYRWTSTSKSEDCSFDVWVFSFLLGRTDPVFYGSFLKQERFTFAWFWFHYLNFLLLLSSFYLGAI